MDGSLWRWGTFLKTRRATNASVIRGQNGPKGPRQVLPLVLLLQGKDHQPHLSTTPDIPVPHGQHHWFSNYSWRYPVKTTKNGTNPAPPPLFLMPRWPHWAVTTPTPPNPVETKVLLLQKKKKKRPKHKKMTMYKKHAFAQCRVVQFH